MSTPIPTLEVKLAGRIIPLQFKYDGKEIICEFAYFKPLLDQIKAMKGAKWHPELKYWTIENCKRNEFAFDKLIRGPRYSRYLKQVEFRLVSPPLWAHQQEIYDFERTRQRCLIGAEPRTGKTRPTLQCFADSIHKLCWWVTTKSASLGLERELYKWFKAVPAEQGHFVFGDKRVVLLSYDKFTSLMKEFPAGTRPPPFVVFDECHKLKTVGSARSEAADKVSEMMEAYYKGEEYVIGLSGTPAPLNITDWWHQCEVIRPGFIREGDIKKFKVRYGEYLPWDGTTPAWERFKGYNKNEVALLSQRLEGLVRVYFQKDCMDLPPIRFEIVKLTPPKSMLRVAKMITETSSSALEIRRRLRQIADGFEYETAYNEEKNKVERVGATFLGSPKIDQLKADLDEYEAVGRIIIYAGFQGSIDIITKTCCEAGWTVLQVDGRGRVLFNPDGTSTSKHESIQLALGEMDRSSDTKSIEKLAFVAEPDAGGSGLELSASPVTIYYSNSDSGEGRMQSKKRAYSNNMDKERGLTIKDYCLLPTDELILKKQDDKQEMQDISMGELVDLYKDIS